MRNATRWAVGVCAAGLLSLLALQAGLVLAQETREPERQPEQGERDEARRPENDKPKALAPADRQFVEQVATTNIAEIEMGRLAKDKAEYDGVKEYAERIVEDYESSHNELRDFAKQRGVSLPQAKRQNNNRQNNNEKRPPRTAAMERLERLSGAEFDRAYVRESVRNHTRKVSYFKSQSPRLKDTDLKEWAEQRTPQLQDHLKQAQDLSRRLEERRAARRAKR